MENSSLSLRPTLVRRVSDLFKDGNTSGSQLFTHSSMQKLRHCCQNLNLFPYLLYSLGDAKTVHKLTINQLIQRFSERLFQLYLGLRLTVITRVSAETSPKSADAAKTIKSFTKFEKQKRQPKSLLLTLTVYLAPVVLACQLIGVLSLLVPGKYTPGFVFLLSSLIFLGYILAKVLLHDSDKQGQKRRGKRKVD